MSVVERGQFTPMAFSSSGMFQHLRGGAGEANPPLVDDDQHIGVLGQQRDLLLHHHDGGALRSRA